jgi:hypothetical protein
VCPRVYATCKCHVKAGDESTRLRRLDALGPGNESAPFTGQAFNKNLNPSPLFRRVEITHAPEASMWTPTLARQRTDWPERVWHCFLGKKDAMGTCTLNESIDLGGEGGLPQY